MLLSSRCRARRVLLAAMQLAAALAVKENEKENKERDRKREREKGKVNGYLFLIH
jgi:hypothetical protein